MVLIQNEKIADFPVVLVGTEFWGDPIAWIREQLAARGLISPGDMELFRLTDDIDEIVEVCQNATVRRWGAADAP